MATAPQFTSALDSLLKRRDFEYSRDMQFSAALLQANQAAQQEDRLRADLAVRSGIAVSQEQRMRDNQSMVNYRNQRIAPLFDSMSSRAAEQFKQLAPIDALKFARTTEDAKNALFTSKANFALRKGDTTDLTNLFGYEVQLVKGKLAKRQNKDAPWRDLVGNELTETRVTREGNAGTAQEVQGGILKQLQSNPELAPATTDTETVAPAAAPAPATDTRRFPPPKGAAAPKLGAIAAPPTATEMGVLGKGVGALNDLFRGAPAPADAPTAPNNGLVLPEFGLGASAEMDALDQQMADLRRQQPQNYEAIVALQQQIDDLQNTA